MPKQESEGPANDTHGSIYDRDEYYADSARGARLTPVLEWLLRVLERYRARVVIEKTGVSTGKLLDVGAGDGKFMHFMERHGFEVNGTTASRRSAAAAQTLFGLRLEVAEDLEGELAEAPFDLVTYWHVFEHLDDPPMHTNRWPRLVRPGGFIVIEVPNFESLGAQLCYRSWLGSDPEHHLNRQSAAAILDLLRQLAFDPISTEYFSGKFSYAYLWSALLGRLFGRSYDFDGVLSILRRPFATMRSHPVRTINALAAIGYLAPVIVVLMLYGVAVGQGEVFRIYAKRRSSHT